MSTKHSGFPVDAAWEAIAENGSVAQYWLSGRTPRQGFPSQFYEVWHWSIACKDGSQPFHGFDWGTSRQSVMEEVGWKKLHVCGDLKKWPRFKRIK